MYWFGYYILEWQRMLWPVLALNVEENIATRELFAWKKLNENEVPT